jgi:hypothetical protein
MLDSHRELLISGAIVESTKDDIVTSAAPAASQ